MSVGHNAGQSHNAKYLINPQSNWQEQICRNGNIRSEFFSHVIKMRLILRIAFCCWAQVSFILPFPFWNWKLKYTKLSFCLFCMGMKVGSPL